MRGDDGIRFSEWDTCRAGQIEARERHKIEGVPHFVSGKYPPSGCAVCGRDRHHHTERLDFFAPHTFAPVLRPGQRAEVRADNLSTILRRMRQRRHTRARWFRDRGFDPCRVCGVPYREHPRSGTPKAYVPPTDDEVLAYVARVRCGRWDRSVHEVSDEGWEEAGRDEIRAGLTDLELDLEAGLDLDDE